MYVDWRLLGSVHGFSQGHCPVKKSKAVISEQPNQDKPQWCLLVTWCGIYSYHHPPWLQRSSRPRLSSCQLCPSLLPLLPSPSPVLSPTPALLPFIPGSFADIEDVFLRFCPWDGIPRLQDISSVSSLGTDPLPCLTMWSLAGWMGSHLVITPNNIWHCNSF